MARLKWNKQSVLDKLRVLHRSGKDLSYTRLAKAMQSLVSAAAYHFGSYRKAVEKAGINYVDVSRRPRWTRQAIIQLIKQGRKDGEDLHWSAVTKRGDELGKAAFAALQPRLFGSWDRALHGAGLDADEIARYRNWDKETIVFWLKARHRENEPLNSGAIQRDDPGLHAAAVRHFGSYDQALRKAKLNPERIRQRRRWDPPTVVRELKTFSRKHGPPTDSKLRQHAPALYGAVLRLYKTVTAAVKATNKKK